MQSLMLLYVTICILFISNFNISEARNAWGRQSACKFESSLVGRTYLINKKRTDIALYNNDICSSIDTLQSSGTLGKLRGGSSDSDDDEETSDYDSDESSYESEEESEEEAEDSEVEESNPEYNEYDTDEEITLDTYDEPLVPNPMSSMIAVVGAMTVFRRFDMYDPQVVRNARIAFIVYISSVMAFSMYVRYKARERNDQRPVEMENAIAGLVKSQINNAMAGSPSSETVKGLANKFLTSVTNVMEYDMQQAGALRNSVLAPMLILWILHFKMKQVQPLLMQIVTGLSNLMYHPLVQVYVMGRNLERPFKKPLSPMEQSFQDQANSEDEVVGQEEEDSEIVNGTRSDTEDAEESDSTSEDETESDNEAPSSEDESEDDEVV